MRYLGGDRGGADYGWRGKHVVHGHDSHSAPLRLVCRTDLDGRAGLRHRVGRRCRTRSDADTKFASYFVGGRDGQCAAWFVDDLRARLAPHLNWHVNLMFQDLHRIPDSHTSCSEMCARAFSTLS
jgi:hypothetical protein